MKGMEKISRKRFNVPLDDKVVTEWWNRQPHPSVALRVLIKHHVASCGGQILDTISLFDKLFDLNGTGNYPQVEGSVIPDKEVETVVKQLVGNNSVEPVHEVQSIKEPVQVVEEAVPEVVVQEEVKPEVKPVKVETIEVKQPEQEPEVEDLDMDAIFGH